MASEILDGNQSGGKTMAGEFDSRLTVLERHAVSIKRITSVPDEDPTDPSVRCAGVERRPQPYDTGLGGYGG
jgi:hypothetical protein